MTYAVAVDIGGTFTDLVAFDRAAGTVAYAKSPTTYDNLVEGILTCFAKAQISPRDVTLASHGTTLVINSLLQRHGAKAALVTTRGFRDLVEIGRGNRADPLDLHFRRNDPFILRDRRFEVAERLDAGGRVHEPLDVAGLRQLAAQLKALGTESIAIFFLHSYLNPEHENEAAAVLKELLPDCFVTVSNALCREISEYERVSTVVANAYVGPQIDSYIRRLERDLSARGFSGSLFMMGSNGGLLSVERTCRQPLALVESGPIGGCIGAGAYAAALGLKNVIAFDMGGTTAKCALVSDGIFSVDSVYFVGGSIFGVPIKSSVIDIVEVGSGGGSIARVDAKGQLHVGPESAGSAPGPVCYGRGGTEPTVTDANLLLGRINEDNFLGGELRLDRPETMQAMRALAARVGFDGGEGAVRLADGIISIATVIMAGAIRRVSIEHGLDPRDFVLFAYGGGGPLHASALARELKIPTVVIPPEPGNFSAMGMLFADARLDQSKTFLTPLTEESMETMRRELAVMEDSIAVSLKQEFGAGTPRFERHAEMRYRGQHNNIKVPIPDIDSLAALKKSFETVYRGRFGQINETGPIEFQVLLSSGFATVQRPDIARLPRPIHPETAPTVRAVHFGAAGLQQAKVYQRFALKPGFAAAGPAVIEEYGSTTLVWPGDRFEVGTLMELRVTCGEAVQRRAARPEAAAEKRALDPITIEVLRHGIVSVADQIEANVTRSAYSHQISEYRDYSVAFIGLQGELIAQCRRGIPTFVADSISRAVIDGIAVYGYENLHHGDFILCNHPEVQGQHLNNTVMFTPVYAGPERGTLIGFFGINMHWIDVGGQIVGLKSKDVFMEGLQLRSVKIWSKGELVEEVYRIVEDNTRYPHELMGDVRAQYMGCLMGRDLTTSLADRYGTETFQRAMATILDQCETAARARIRSIPNGTYHGESFLDNDGLNEEAVPLKVKVVVEDESVTVDFTDMPDELPTAFNSGYYGGGRTVARLAYKYLIASDLPPNEGTYRALKMILPQGKMISASRSAPIASYSLPLPSIIDTVIRAMEHAMPAEVTAGHFGSHSSVRFYGQRPDGRFFSCHDGGVGGHGASSTHDGGGPFRTLSHGDNRLVPIETHERSYPFLLQEFGMRCDSAGPGKWRGCGGTVKQYLITGPCTLYLNFDRTLCLPWGVHGGGTGQPGRALVYKLGAAEPLIFTKVSGVALDKGDIVRLETGGGGGYGAATERSLELVQRDLDCGYISREGAMRDYGVAVGADGRVRRAGLVEA